MTGAGGARRGPELPGAAWLEPRLAALLGAYGLPLPDGAAARFAGYLALLLPWNERVNLTAARTAQRVVDEHLADGVALLPLLPSGPHRLVDVGAGAGFVGVTVALLRPDARCVLLEPSAKRHAFLRAVARELPVANLEPRAQRLEDHLADGGAGAYDVAVSRATWPPAEWLARAPALLRPGGVAIGYEGGRRLALPERVERVPRATGSRGALLLRRAPA